MQKIYKNIGELTGQTPLLRVCHIEEKEALKAKLLIKLEFFNPAGSVKDRAAKQMIEDAEAQGILKKETVIIEPTSGNMGIALASLAAAKGYRTIFTMPETMSTERRKLLTVYGAHLVLTDGKEGMDGAVRKAKELKTGMENAVILGQFENPSNPKAHMETTAVEIWEDTEGEVDIFVAGVGTGGTISGVGNYLKRKKASVQVIAVEPAASAVLSGKKAGNHGLQGLGAGFVPEILDTDVYDKVITVEDEEAYAAVNLLAKKEGVLAGISSGAALHAAISEAKKEENAGKTIVALMPDGGERYLSTPLFEH